MKKLALILALMGLLLVSPYRVTEIRGESMEPLFYTGDRAILVRCTDYPDPGEIVLFETYDNSGKVILVIHRVVYVDRENDLIKTKGDNNNWIDQREIHLKDIKYKYVCKI